VRRPAGHHTGICNSHGFSCLVVVADFDIERVAVDEPKTDAPLIIDRDGMLTLPIVL